MQVNKKDAAIIQRAISQWEKNNLIDEQKANELRDSIQDGKDDFASFTFYAFVAAISCAILAFGAIVLDEKWIERMRRFFEFSELVIGTFFLGLSIFLGWIAKKRKVKHPYATMTNESFNILIVLSLGVAITYIARSFENNSAFFGTVVFFLAIAYGTTAIYLKSKLVWVCALLTFVVSFAIQTWFWTAPRHEYFLGMNYPLRMTVLGALLLIITALLRRFKVRVPYYEATMHFFWVFFLMSGLFLSVSGNLSYDVWSDIRQGKLFLWAIGYTVIMCALVYYAYVLKDEFFRDVVIIFFLLNIYTRYFEYFWDKTNKGIFFALLALSFWLIGRKAEQMRKKFME